jgi:adenylate cyclase
LRAQARTSAAAFKGKHAPVPAVARELGVGYIVEGSVTQNGNRVRITARLTAADGGPMWSDSVDCRIEDMFTVQSALAEAIARRLQLKPDATLPARAVRPEVWSLVLQGRFFWSLRTAEGFARADEAFTKAIRLDPANAEAHAGLASMCVIREQYRVSRMGR